ncbi:HAAF-like protein, partial [Mya arenaria]
TTYIAITAGGPSTRNAGPFFLRSCSLYSLEILEDIAKLFEFTIFNQDSNFLPFCDIFCTLPPILCINVLGSSVDIKTKSIAGFQGCQSVTNNRAIGITPNFQGSESTDRRHTIAYLIVSLLLIGKASAVNYVNNLDAEFFFECPNPDEFVSHMESVHDNGAEDRRFAFSCKKVTSNGELHAGVHCLQKSGYQNTYDHLLAFQCSDNSFINGMGSRHDNGAEDRIWQFKCCDIPGTDATSSRYAYQWPVRQHLSWDDTNI